MSGVTFVTQQGRVLHRDDLTAADITRALGALIEVVGYESPSAFIGEASPVHASTRHIVEWWDDE